MSDLNTLKIYARCCEPGTLTLFMRRPAMEGNTVIARPGVYSYYTFTSAESMQKTASGYDEVDRGGKPIRGRDYTLRMAQNDWKKFARTDAARLEDED